MLLKNIQDLTSEPVVFSLLLQLFKKLHPPKRVRSRINGEMSGVSVPPGASNDKIFFHHLDNLRPSLAPVKGKWKYFVYSWFF